MRLNFNVQGLKDLTDAVRQIGKQAGSAAVGATQSIRGNRTQNPTSGPGSQHFVDWMRQQIQGFNKQSLGGVGGVNVNGQWMTPQAAIGNLNSVMRQHKSVFPNLNYQDPNQQNAKGGSRFAGVARVIGAGARFAQNAAPYQLGGLVSTMAAGGPVGMAIGSAIAVLGLFTAAVLSGTKALNQYGANQTTAIATAEQAAKLQSIARAIGVDAEALAGLASGKPGGAQQLLAEIESVLGLKDEKSRQFLIRELKLPPELEQLVRGFTDNERKNILSGNGRMRSDEDLAKAARREKVFGDVSENWQRFKEKFANNMADWIEGPLPKKALTNPLMETLLESLPVTGGNKNGMFNPAGANRAQDTAKSKMDKAAEKFLSSAEKMKEAADIWAWTSKKGTFGGIDPVRASNAYPSSWAFSFDQLRRQNNLDILHMGAFTV